MALGKVSLGAKIDRKDDYAAVAFDLSFPSDLCVKLILFA